MSFASNILVYLVAVLHVWFMVLESFLWAKPIGLKTFRMTPEKAGITKVLAMNQGLYNGFLAAGLFWGACTQDFTFKIFFLSCVIVAGIVGAITVGEKILYVQFFPGMTALILVYLNKIS